MNLGNASALAGMLIILAGGVYWAAAMDNEVDDLTGVAHRTTEAVEKIEQVLEKQQSAKEREREMCAAGAARPEYCEAQGYPTPED